MPLYYYEWGRGPGYVIGDDNRIYWTGKEEDAVMEDYSKEWVLVRCERDIEKTDRIHIENSTDEAIENMIESYRRDGDTGAGTGQAGVKPKVRHKCRCGCSE